jgi:hypothetical protein
MMKLIIDALCTQCIRQGVSIEFQSELPKRSLH